MHIDGGCHCGAVTFAATIDPALISICHCTDCQTLTGSAYRVTAIVADGKAIELRTGYPSIYDKRGDSGRISHQHFCGACGTPLFFSSSRDLTGPAGIRWGSIAQRAQLTPKMQIWCRSALPWIHDLRDVPGRESD